MALSPTLAQEGEKARSNKKKLRETRYKIKDKQGDKIQKTGYSGKKVKSKKIKRSPQKALHPAPNPYAGRKRKTEAERYNPGTGVFNQPSRSNENHRAGDISGKRLKYNTKTARNRQPSHYAQPNPYANRKQRTESQRAKSNSPQLNSIRSVSGIGGGGKKKKKRITPRTASRPYIARTKSNASIYYGRKRKGESANRKTIAGKKFKSPRSITQSAGVIKPSFNPYYARKNKGDNAYKGKITSRKNSITKKGEQRYSGKATGGFRTISKRGEQKYSGRAVGGYKTATKKGERAWKNDITGRPFKSPKDPGLVQGKKGQPLFNSYNNKLKGNKNVTGGRLLGGGYLSATPKGERSRLSKNPNTSRRLSKSGTVQQGKSKPIIGTSTQNPSISGFSGRIKSSGRLSSGGGSISKSGWNNGGKALNRNPPGAGTQEGSQFKGRFNRFTISPGFDTRSAGYKGNIKGARRPLKGGGSISKSGWNNRGNALTRNPPGAGTKSGTQFKGRFDRFTISPGFDTRSAGYRGNIKGNRKPLKGGGSISKSGWNNKGNALIRKPPSAGTKSGTQFKGRFDRFTISPGFDTRSAGYQGNIKGNRKPLKGGGSISKSGWNNKGNALTRNPPGEGTKSGTQFKGRFDRFTISPGFDTRSAGYQGNIKGHRKPLKGGGSISHSGWNNKGNALTRNPPGEGTKSGTQFKGRFDRFTISPGFDTRSAGYQGNIKGHRKPLKGGGSISHSGWNNKQTPLPRKDNFRSSMSISQGNIKGARKPLKGGGSISKSGWNNKQTPLQKKPLTFQNFYTSKFEGRFKRTYFWSEYATDGIGFYQGQMKGSRKKERIPAGKGSSYRGDKTIFEIMPGYLAEEASTHPGNLKRKNKYKQNPNSDEDALKMIPPKSSAYQAMSFQGNFKVKKTYKKGMHPSSKYTTYHKPLNSLEEKDKTFKFRIWWAKLIKKNENQPPAVKDKVRKPRYDKNEKDLWYE